MIISESHTNALFSLLHDKVPLDFEFWCGRLVVRGHHANDVTELVVLHGKAYGACQAGLQGVSGIYRFDVLTKEWKQKTQRSV
ncbi:hypothetical protein CDAR_12111 [Caerostris darwini]|uniref:Uncharacterized protein n=1 Tax=Caerostris darwini TaxID=1538125 RepID=A0AAV4M3J0_9ARAC|nr:hypothetical protein CDAR_12111 [Caerostris darwini]